MTSILESRSKHNAQDLSKEDRVFQFLREHQTGVLATASPGGKPNASVIYYTADAALNITFITKRRTQKGENLHVNNLAELVVYDEKSQSTASVAGRVVEIDNQEEASQIFRNALRASLSTAESAVPPISKITAGNYVAYRIEPGVVSMAVFNKRGSKQPEGMFEIIKK